VAADHRWPEEEAGLRRLGPADPALAEVLALVRTEFAYMEGRIDPPSSMHRLDVPALAAQAAEGEIWVIGRPVRACVFLTVLENRLYVGKLAVAAAARGRGYARCLVDLAETRARALGLDWLELQTRIELIDNHATFAAMGFRQTAETAHPGFDRPTSLTFRRPVSSPAAP
jgi:GNAT superfamily N-acetyltransferase